MDLKFGEYKVIESGSAIQLLNFPFEFTLTEIDSDNQEDTLFASITFISDTSIGGTEVRMKAITQNSGIIEFVNMPTGSSGSEIPIPVGSLAKKDLLLHFQISKPQINSPILLNYTWYLKMGVNS